MDLFTTSPGITVIYLSLLGIGIIYAILILIGNEIGGLHIPGMHIPGVDLHLGGHDIDIGQIDVGSSLDQPNLHLSSLSPITIASFVTAFGGFGLIALSLFDATARTSLIWATGGGFVVAVIAHFAFGYFLIGSQGSSEVRLSEVPGTIAEVITPIPADSVGEIAFVAQGERVTYTAQSANQLPIGRGTIVIIEKIIGGVAFVRPQEQLTQK
jgi:hypothetical protein